MPVPESSDLKTVSFVLTQDQVRRLRARKEMRSSTLHRVSFSDVCREVVEAGLAVLSHGRDMSKTTSPVDTQEVAA